MTQTRKTYTLHGFSLSACKKLNLSIEDLALLNWFLDFHPAMIKICENNKEYGWLNYRYLLENLQIISYKEEALAKRFNRYCELGLLEKAVRMTQLGKRAYFRPTPEVVSLRFHTDEKRDAENDKNNKAHTDEKRDAIYSYNSSTNNSSTIDSEKIYKKENPDILKSHKEIERFFQNKCNEVINGVEVINNDFSKEEISLLAEFAINRIKGKNNIKNTKTALKSSIYNRAIKIKASLGDSGVCFSEIFRKDEDVYIYLMKDGGSRVVDSLDQWIVDRVLKDKQIKKNNSTVKDSNQDYLDKKVEKLITEIKSELLEYPDDFYNRSTQLRRTAEDWKIIENNSKIHEKYNIKDYRFVLDYILEIKQPCGKKGVPRAEFMSSYKNEFINMYGESSVLALYNYFIATKDEKFFPSVEDYGK